MVYFNDTAHAERIMATYRTLPALRLSIRQAARLFNLPVGECQPVMQRLVDDGELQRTADGCYVASPGVGGRCGVGAVRRAE